MKVIMKNLICSGIWFVQIASVLLSIDRILIAPARLKGDEYPAKQATPERLTLWEEFAGKMLC